MKSGCIWGVKAPYSDPVGGLLKLNENESSEADRGRSSGSEKVADVGRECARPGGEPATEVWMGWAWLCAFFSDSFLRLMMVLMSSLCFLRASLLLHHMGRLYSHTRPRCLQAVHMGEPSSHFFRLSLHVKQPYPRGTVNVSFRALSVLFFFRPVIF